MNLADYEAWANALLERLLFVEAQYRQANRDLRKLEGDPEELRMEATLATAFSVLDTASALSRLPQFAGWKGLLPLQDLAMAMADLGKGNKPSMLMPRAGVGLGGDTHDKNYVKKQIVAGVEALKACGMDQKPAAAIVAREFANAGMKGRKKGRFPEGTAVSWVGVLAGDAVVWKQIQDFVESWKQDQTNPISIASVTAWVRRTARSAEVQSKI